MTTGQLDLFDVPSSSVRRSDPRSAKSAAAHDPNGRDHQRRLILAALVEQGPLTADDCALVIDRHRSVASTRLNVLRKAGHAEKCGLTPQPDCYGRVRDVELHRATRAGIDWLYRGRL